MEHIEYASRSEVINTIAVGILKDMWTRADPATLMCEKITQSLRTLEAKPQLREPYAPLLLVQAENTRGVEFLEASQTVADMLGLELVNEEMLNGIDIDPAKHFVFVNYSCKEWQKYDHIAEKASKALGVCHVFEDIAENSGIRNLVADALEQKRMGRHPLNGLVGAYTSNPDMPTSIRNRTHIVQAMDALDETLNIVPTSPQRLQARLAEHRHQQLHDLVTQSEATKSRFKV